MKQIKLKKVVEWDYGYFKELYPPITLLLIFLTLLFVTVIDHYKYIWFYLLGTCIGNAIIGMYSEFKRKVYWVKVK